MSHRRSPSARRHPSRPRLEGLEPRYLLATLTVTTAADSGAGSLRAAIVAADADGAAGVDEIDFAIGTSGMQEIRPATPLPTITRPVFLNGKSEPGYAGVPLVDVDGALEATTGIAGLDLSGGGSTVEGLQVTGFASTPPADGTAQSAGGQGILLSGPGGDLIAADYVGPGSPASAVRGNGIGIEVLAPNETIGGTGGLGDVISGSNGVRSTVSGAVGTAGDGILVTGEPGVVIQGDRIGTDAQSGYQIANSGDGIALIDATGPLVGGPDPGDGNVVGHSGQNGILLNAQGVAGGASDATIQGNDIGLDSAANSYQLLGETLDGILVQSAGNTIGGTTPGASNVVGNSFVGISIQPVDAGGAALAGGGGNLVEGNFVGTTPDMAIPYSNQRGGDREPNGYSGILALGGGTIGGTVAGAGNLVSYNGLPGDAAGRDARFGIIAEGFLIQGNLVGSNQAGTSNEANIGGVALRGSDTLGGTTAAARNLISGNYGPGVFVDSLASDPVGSIVIEGNSIGMNLAGTGELSNFGAGIIVPDTVPDVSPAPAATGSVVIGGTDPGAGNVISGNYGSGITLGLGHYADSLGTVTVQGNQIAFVAGSNFTYSNEGDGIDLLGSATPTTIGGTAAGAGNTIAQNGGTGIEETYAGEQIIGNAVYSNGTATNSSYPYGGNVLAYTPQIESPSYVRYAPPTLTAAITQGGNVTIDGTFAGAPGEVREFDFFAGEAPTTPGLTYGGAVYLGSASFTADANGLGSIQATYPIPSPPASIGPAMPGYTSFTATAIYPAPATPVAGGLGNFGGTSSFSNPALSQASTAATSDIALAEVSGPAGPLNPGATGTFTFTVTNAGTVASEAVTLNEYFPDGGPLLSATTTKGSIAFKSDGSFQASLGTLQPGQVATIAFRAGFTGVAGGNFAADGVVTSLTADVDGGNNALTYSVPISSSAPAPTEADLSLAGTVTPGSAAAGDQVVYALTASDLGPATADNAVVFYTLASGTIFVSASSSQGSVDFDAGPTADGGILSAYLGPIASGADATLTITVRIDPSARPGMTTAQGVVRSDEPDGTDANNHIDQAVTIG